MDAKQADIQKNISANNCNWKIYFKYAERNSRWFSRKLINKEWEPKEEHKAVIARSIEFISDELAELQQYLHCPNSFIVEIANRNELSNFAWKLDCYWWY